MSGQRSNAAHLGSIRPASIRTVRSRPSSHTEQRWDRSLGSLHMGQQPVQPLQHWWRHQIQQEYHQRSQLPLHRVQKLSLQG